MQKEAGFAVRIALGSCFDIAKLPAGPIPTYGVGSGAFATPHAGTAILEVRFGMVLQKHADVGDTDCVIFEEHDLAPCFGFSFGPHRQLDVETAWSHLVSQVGVVVGTGMPDREKSRGCWRGQFTRLHRPDSVRSRLGLATSVGQNVAIKVRDVVIVVWGVSMDAGLVTAATLSLEKPVGEAALTLVFGPSPV